MAALLDRHMLLALGLLVLFGAAYGALVVTGVVDHPVTCNRMELTISDAAWHDTNGTVTATVTNAGTAPAAGIEASVAVSATGVTATASTNTTVPPGDAVRVTVTGVTQSPHRLTVTVPRCPGTYARTTDIAR